MHNDDLQRNAEWFEARLGIPTASRYKDVMTQPRSKADKEAGKLSDTANSYMLEILSEKLTGERKEFSSAATDWGNYNEPLAVEAYQEKTGVEVLECGFVKHKEIATGASPDGIIGLNGTLEIKCPFNSANHLKNKLTGEVPKEYVWQVQGQMWILGTEWNDFVSFDPRMDINAGLSIVRVYRDEKLIKQLEDSIIRFNEQLQLAYDKLTTVEF
jgi:putative phage-type endonuclease